MELEELLKIAEEKIYLGRELINDLESLSHIEGVKKVQRKIVQEIKFLEKVTKNQTIQISNILCSNLTHFKSLVEALRKYSGVKNVDFPVPFSPGGQKTIRIDIVADNGATWVKVIARNSKSIKDQIAGNVNFGARSVLDHAEELIATAKLNPHIYEPPKVIFLFVHPIEDDLELALNEIGVEVQNFAFPASQDKKEVDKLNLDVTTLIAYTSALTNGSNDCDFGDRILNQQAEMERKNPIRPVLDKLFEGKQLICCETAVQAFQNIVDLLAGPGERARAKEFLARMEILPDVDISEGLAEVTVTGQVKERSLKIFAFGVFHKALNVTGNEGFYRSVKMQGVDVPVYLHEARALTEMKELKVKS